MLAPLRASKRVASDIESIATAVLEMAEPLDRIDRNVTGLQQLEEAITVRVDALHADVKTRMLALEEQVHRLQPPIAEMSRDLANAKRLLPEPTDGPFARLRDSLTPS